MSLLAPWFLLGLGLIAGPIIAHLIRRATRQRVAFSAVRFLEETRPRLERRSRLQHPWLLLIRCLVLALLALAFARPYWSTQDTPPAPTSVHRQLVVILDESASMQRAGLWAAAQARVQALTAQLRPQDRFVLLTAGEQVRELITLDQWLDTEPRQRNALIETTLAQRRPGFGPTPLDAAVEAALTQWELMAETDAGAAHQQLIIISDFTTSARVAALASLNWPEGATVALESVTPTSTSNASVHWLGWTTTADGEPAVRVRLQRSFDTTGALYWQVYDAQSGAALGRREAVELLPGGAQALTVPWPTGDVRAVRFELSGDAEPFDNAVWIARPESRELVVSHLGRPSPDDPQSSAYFIGRALGGLAEPRTRLTNSLDDAGASTLIIANEPLDAGTTTLLRRRLDAGAFLVLLLNPTHASELLTTAAQLAGESGWRPRALERSDALLGQMDFRHPLFAPFADPLYSDFTRIRFWQPQSIELPDNSAAVVVARFDDSSPAVIEVPVGEGRLIVWGSDWTPLASQWVLSSKFVPWLQALAERAAGGAAQPTMIEIGSPRATRAQPIAPGRATREEAIPGVTVPGIYTFDDSGRRTLAALNVPASESRLESLPLDVWEQLGVPLETATSLDRDAQQLAQQRRAQNAVVLEQRQQVWRALLWAALVLLATESVVSRVLARRRADAPDAIDPRDLPPAERASV